MGGWGSATNDAGVVYFYNQETGESQWECPRERRYFLPGLLREQFSRTELRSFRRSFKLYDQNANGSMDADEVKLCLRDLGVRVSARRLKFLMSEADADRSGEIEFDEFVLLVFGIRRGAVGIGRFLLALLFGCEEHPIGFRARTPLTRCLERFGFVGPKVEPADVPSDVLAIENEPSSTNAKEGSENLQVAIVQEKETRRNQER